MALQFCRWDPELPMTGLRFSNVMEPADYAQFPGFDADPALRQWNLWGYIDARDGAQAVRLALTADPGPGDVFVIADADTVMSRAERGAGGARCSRTSRCARTWPSTRPCWASTRPAGVLGFDPQHSWRDHV